MTPNERAVLTEALHTLESVVVDHYMSDHQLSNTPDLYDYRSVGKMVIGKRILSELLSQPFNNLMPGEQYHEDVEYDDHLEDFYRFTIPGDYNTPLTTTEKQFLISKLLGGLEGIGGLGDIDDACMRVARRQIAEVAGYPDLRRYRLLFESTVKPMYFHDYQPLVEFN